MTRYLTIPVCAAVIALTWPTMALAGSQAELTATNQNGASVHLDFTIMVPEFLAVRVGAHADPLAASRMGQSLSIPLAHRRRGESNAAGDSQESVAQALGNAGTLALAAEVSASGSNGAMPDGPATADGIADPQASGFTGTPDTIRTVFTISLP